MRPALFLGLLALVSPAAFAQEKPRPLLGEKAPEWKVERWDLPEGTSPPTVAALAGKVVVILCFQYT